jgi:hypothetical protein
VGHATLRQGNAEREQAVIIRDPGYDSGCWPDGDPVLRFALSEHFDNAWDIFGDNRNLSVKDFIENFEMSAEDKRRYQAVQNVRYALQNQSEYNNLGKRRYDEPFYYNFAGLADKEPGIWTDPFKLPFADVVKKLELERYWEPKEMGIADSEFFDKLKFAGAIMSLRYSCLETHPNATFARLGLENQVAQRQIVQIQRDLHERLEDKVKEKRGAGAEHHFGLDSHGTDDFRVLFPLFREIYEADKSTGPQREYLDTIMAGLQKWFPTLTNGPVPDLKDGAAEPPRSLPKAGPAPSDTPKPGPTGTLAP